MISNFRTVIIRLLAVASLCLLLFSSNLFSQSKKLFEDNEIQCQDKITVIASNDLNFNVLKNTTSYYSDNNVIKFKIKSTDNIHIKISKSSQTTKSDGLKLYTNWRMGESSGFEENFSPTKRIYLKSSNDRTYYVTMEIESIYAPNNCRSGSHRFDQTIYVEIDE